MSFRKSPVPLLFIQLNVFELVDVPGITTLSPWQIICAGPALAVGFFWIVNTIESWVAVQPIEGTPVKVNVTDPAPLSPGLNV